MGVRPFPLLLLAEC